MIHDNGNAFHFSALFDQPIQNGFDLLQRVNSKNEPKSSNQELTRVFHDAYKITAAGKNKFDTWFRQAAFNVVRGMKIISRATI
jgi:hypothetical protein